MGSMLKFDSDRRELVRVRRDARIERKQQRRRPRPARPARGCAQRPLEPCDKSTPPRLRCGGVHRLRRRTQAIAYTPAHNPGAESICP